MQLAVCTDVFANLPYAQMLDKVKALGVDAIEMTAGGWGKRKHGDASVLLADSEKLAIVKEELEKRKMRISALNSSCNPLVSTKEGRIDKQSMYDCATLAGKLGVKKVTAMSGLPAGNESASWPNFASSAYNAKWDVTIAFWKEYVQYCKSCGIEKIAIEVIPGTMVWSVDTLLKLRDAVDPMIGINFDPSHMIVQGTDPIKAIRPLKNCIFHVHCKDACIREDVIGMSDLLNRVEQSEDIWKFVAIGRGKNIEWWREFFTALEQLGYHGDVALDMSDLRNEEATEEDVIYSIETLKKVI